MAWTRKILRVDLSRGTCIPEALNMAWAQDYLGQRGLATKYLAEEIDPTCDALGPDNKLIMATGPLTGTMASTGGRYSRDQRWPGVLRKALGAGYLVHLYGVCGAALVGAGPAGQNVSGYAKRSSDKSRWLVHRRCQRGI